MINKLTKIYESVGNQIVNDSDPKFKENDIDYLVCTVSSFSSFQLPLVLHLRHIFRAM